MEHKLENTIAMLERTPAALDALLRGVPAEWTECDEGGETWNVPSVMAHLLHCEHVDFMPRLRMILEFGEGRTFEPLDREGSPRSGAEKSLDELLDEFRDQRAKNLAELRALHLGTEDMNRRGMHPLLGSVTLSQFLATWPAHDLTHLHQISRIMAHQYREAVGPWVRFLGVMQCAGHSSQA
ncbi:MAG TPA: DinB family protein [Terracidiphilus sp.]|nr:DinB family protein [Terracidiphilus sp.]